MEKVLWAVIGQYLVATLCVLPSAMAHKFGVPVTTNPFGTISKRTAVVPTFVVGHRQSGAMEYPSNLATIKPVAKRFSITMVLLLPELILKTFQHGQEFSKCALGLSELVIFMAHSLWMDTMVAMPALASQSSALPCCALFHPHRHTISVGQGHSKCN